MSAKSNPSYIIADIFQIQGSDNRKSRIATRFIGDRITALQDIGTRVKAVIWVTSVRSAGQVQP